jgi:hypothetical protein
MIQVMADERRRDLSRALIITGVVIATLGFFAPAVPFALDVPTVVGWTFLIGGPSLVIVGLVVAGVGLTRPRA